MAKHWADFQYEIYLGGMGGSVPRLPTDLRRLEELAEHRLGAGPVGYVAGSAGDGGTARANRAALDRRRIVPRLLRDVSDRDLSVEVLGRVLPAPLALAPVGVLSIVHPEAEVAAARAAAAQGVPYILSSASSTPMEQVAEVLGDAERWFQLYWAKDREVTRSFLDRAKASGYSVLVVTLDTPLLGWRPATWSGRTCRSCTAWAPPTTSPTRRSGRASPSRSTRTRTRPCCTSRACSGIPPRHGPT